MTTDNRNALLAIGAFVIAAVILGAVIAAHARGDGWEDTPPAVRQWFQSLMQPDAPTISCCGEADAYYADEFEVEGDHYVAIVTDTRPDVFRNGTTRPHIEPGTRVRIPNGKMKWDAGNPTGHGIVFIGNRDQLYCYVAPGGV